ncbi:OpgC domain-containing protein [Gordonia caeni]|uniref:DUF418 domain-containing protein n=1 Tax=Gordonia caeni TaxID=1007097 RepID=A0ABP7PAX3_9ACTN
MRRDLAIDATRGLAIWSMVSLHFANGMLIARPTHAYPLVDGMSAFVLLSGLVLGIVYRGWIDRFTLRYAYGRLARRLAALYVAQVFISLAAVIAGLYLTAPQFRLIAVLPPDLPIGRQLWWMVTLRFLPSGGSILVVYLILLSLAFLVLPLLKHRQWPRVLTASGVGYVLSQTVSLPGMVITSHPGGGPIQNWMAWQVLFVPAMVIGWKWTDWRIPQRLDAALPALLAAAAVGWVTLAHGMWFGDWLATRPDLIGKVGLGPVRVVAAWLAVTCVYAVFRRLLQWMTHDWFRPLVMVGARSLDSYVIQAVALLAIPTWIVFRPWGPGLSALMVLAVFAGCWCWAEVRLRWRIDKLHRLPLVLAGGRFPGGRRERLGATGPEQAGESRRILPERARREPVAR